jgi:hypothetical protein
MLWSLVALVPLVAIYFLKVRPRKKPTTAFFLWQRVFQSQRTSSLFQRLRDVWSLVLMALAAAAVCFALARPEWTDERQDLLIVIDHSASMAAAEGRATRLELARRTAADVVEGLGGNQRAAIATVGRRLTYLSHLTDNPRELLDAIERVEQSADALDWSALDELDLTAEHNADNAAKRQHRVLLVSDGSFAGHELPEPIELLKVGTPQENVGIVAADMAYLPGGSNRLAFYFQVASTFVDAEHVDLTVTCLDDSSSGPTGERLFKVIPLTVKPGVQPAEVFTLEDAPPGRWRAELEIDDALAADNTAQLVAIRPPPVRMAVDATDPFFFENSVLAFAEGHDLLALVGDDDESPADVSLAKGAAPDMPHAIIFQPEGDSPWWSDLGDEVEVAAPRVIAEDHPALRHLDPAAISFVGARQLTPPEGAQVLVTDERGVPLIYVASRGGQSAVVVNIDPLAADFYFSAWFPVLVHSAGTYLVGRELPLAASYRPGDAVPIPGARDDTFSQLNNLERQVDAQLSTLNTQLHGKWWTGAADLGFYQLENESGDWPVGISLLAAEETMLDNTDATNTDKPLSRGHAPAYWLTVLAIGVLAAESLLYHRRKVG